MPDFAHLLSTLSPSFLPLAWAKGGNCLALPTFHPPFPHPSYPLYGRKVGIAWLCPPFVHPFPILLPPCMGEGWELPGFAHLSTTLSPSFLPLVWAKGGNCLASPTSCPPFPHPSQPLPKPRLRHAKNKEQPPYTKKVQMLLIAFGPFPSILFYFNSPLMSSRKSPNGITSDFCSPYLRTLTCPFSCSWSPMTSMYGILSIWASRIL